MPIPDAGGNTETSPGGAEASPGLPALWSGRSILSGAGALFMGVVLGVEVEGFAELALPSPGPPTGPGSTLLLAPFLACFGGPFALVASLLAVLPTASAARWASARFTGRDVWWWVPVVAVVLVTAGVAVLGAARRPGPGLLTLSWLTGTALLTAAALVARDSALNGGRLRRVLGYGMLAAVAVFGVGSAVFATGLVTEYRPPTVDAAELAGRWTDGKGGHAATVRRRHGARRCTDGSRLGGRARRGVGGRETPLHRARYVVLRARWNHHVAAESAARHRGLLLRRGLRGLEDQRDSGPARTQPGVRRHGLTGLVHAQSVRGPSRPNLPDLGGGPRRRT